MLVCELFCYWFRINTEVRVNFHSNLLRDDTKIHDCVFSKNTELWWSGNKTGPSAQSAYEALAGKPRPTSPPRVVLPVSMYCLSKKSFYRSIFKINFKIENTNFGFQLRDMLPSFPPLKNSILLITIFKQIILNYYILNFVNKNFWKLVFSLLIEAIFSVLPLGQQKWR